MGHPSGLLLYHTLQRNAGPSTVSRSLPYPSHTAGNTSSPFSWLEWSIHLISNLLSFLAPFELDCPSHLWNCLYHSVLSTQSDCCGRVRSGLGITRQGLRLWLYPWLSHVMLRTPDKLPDFASLDLKWRYPNIWSDFYRFNCMTLLRRKHYRYNLLVFLFKNYLLLPVWRLHKSSVAHIDILSFYGVQSLLQKVILKEIWVYNQNLLFVWDQFSVRE